MRFKSGDAATVGWITKRGDWAITEAGIEALGSYPMPIDLYRELHSRYREIDQRRKQAQEDLKRSPAVHRGHAASCRCRSLDGP